jgi:hypothetical protein
MNVHSEGLFTDIASVPYSGNLGILVGFFVIPLCVLAFILPFTRYRHDPTTLNLRVSHLHCGCLADNELVIRIARVVSFIAAICVLGIGIIHVVMQRFNWCAPGGPYDCIGPSLRWNPTGRDFLFAGNGPYAGGWASSFFTLAIDPFMDMWGPIIMGLISIGQHLNGHQIEAISISWPRVFLWYMFVGLFAAFGYAGNLGVLTGFLCVFVSFLALAISLGGGAHTRTHLDLLVYGLKGQVTMVTAGATASKGFEVV